MHAVLQKGLWHQRACGTCTDPMPALMQRSEKSARLRSAMPPGCEKQETPCFVWRLPGAAPVVPQGVLADLNVGTSSNYDVKTHTHTHTSTATLGYTPPSASSV